MTKSQQKMVERIRKDAERMTKELHKNGEFKTWEIDENEYFVSVYVVVGGVGDEGTLAGVICRERCHLFIGKRGGVTYPVSRELKNGNWKHYEKRWNGSLLRVHLEQNRL